MPRPKSLTHDQIAAAALAVVDDDGLDALSMRAVAAELGMGTMSLYRYVTAREQLEDLVIDHVLADVDLTPPDGPWPRRLAALAGRIRTALASHPAVVPLTLTRRHGSAGILRFGERVLEILTEAGFTGHARVIALRGVNAYIIGAIQQEHLGALSGPGTAALAALPAGEHPLLTENARIARGVPPDEEFGQGLDLLIRGLRASLGE